MKYQKPSAEQIAQIDEVRATRQRYYDRLAACVPPEGIAETAVESLTVGKGPRGKFYVKRGKEIVSGPFESEAAAKNHAANVA